MKAKDTVMKPEEISKIIKDYCGNCRFCATNTSVYPEPRCFNDALLQAQAEITGKIMYDEGFKAGQKEVVEWIDKHPVFIQNNTLGIKVPIAVSPDWGVQLKEWEEE